MSKPSSGHQKRPYPALRHNLYAVDLEHQTAFCTACGHTEIHVAKSRTNQKSKVICVNRFQEISEARKLKRRLNLGRKPGHSLSQVDSQNMIAICSVCGPTKIRKRTYKESTYYACATTDRAYGRVYRRSHYIAKTTNPHALSEIDEERKTAVCATCGLVKIEIWRGKKKINRRCINARSKVLLNSKSPEKGIENNAHETL